MLGSGKLQCGQADSGESRQRAECNALDLER